MAVVTELLFRLIGTESQAPISAGAKPASLVHEYLTPLGDSSGLRTLTNGTADNEADRVYSTTFNLVASPTNVDIRGGINSQLDGSSLEFVEPVGVIVCNNSTVTGENITIGGGANPFFTDFLGSATDTVVIGPGGLFVWWSPQDGGTTVAGTGDGIQLDPGAATISCDVMIIGRSA